VADVAVQDEAVSLIDGEPSGTPAIVLPDADLEKVIPAVLASGLVNSGQACNATTRLVVPAARLGEVEELIRGHVADFTMGDPFDAATRMGPLSSVAHGASVVGFIERAQAAGGRFLSAGRVAGDTRFGLSAEVWGPADEAVAVAGRLHVGQVKINGVRTRERPGVPFGGVGESGYGRELGALGIMEFTDVTAVMA
jgi:aldehyde dehydrogenase (NAD+)